MEIQNLTFRIADPIHGVYFFYLVRRGQQFWVARSEQLLEVTEVEDDQFFQLSTGDQQYILSLVQNIMTPQVRLDISQLDYNGPSYCLIATSRSRVSKVRECFSRTKTGELCVLLQSSLDSYFRQHTAVI